MFKLEKSLYKIFISILTICFISTNICYASEQEKKKHRNLKKGVYLIASKNLDSTALGETVIYITQHDEAGTAGLVVNRPTNLSVNEAFPDTQASEETNGTLYFGGLLHTQYLFMLTETQFNGGLFPINQNVCFGTGEAMSVRLRSHNKRDKIRTFAGFMSWGPEQLEVELDNGDWILAPADSASLFATNTDSLWADLYSRWAGSWI